MYEKFCTHRKFHVVGKLYRYRACTLHLQCQFIMVPQLLKIFFLLKENWCMRMSCGLCPRFPLWNHINILPLEVLCFLGMFTELQKVTTSLVMSLHPHKTVRIPLYKFL